MAVEDDTIDWITSQVEALGLEYLGTEISGGGYAQLVPSYAPAGGGTTDLESTLTFDGPADDPVDAVRFIRGGVVWFTRDLLEVTKFKTDGQLDLISAPINVAVNG